MFTSNCLYPNISSKLACSYSVVKQRLDYNLLPTKQIEDKMRLLINPYNKEIGLEKHIRFEDEDIQEPTSPLQLEQLKQKLDKIEVDPSKIRDRWKYLSRFVLNQEDKVFRMALKSINQVSSLFYDLACYMDHV